MSGGTNPEITNGDRIQGEDGFDLTLYTSSSGDIVLDANGDDGYIIFNRNGSEVARWDGGGSERLLLNTQVIEFDKSVTSAYLRTEDENCGTLYIQGGDSVSSNGSVIQIEAGDSTFASGGSAYFYAGDGFTGGGSINLFSGGSAGGTAGSLYFNGGTGTTGGHINITPGPGTAGNGGNLYCKTGNGTAGNGGTITLTTGTGGNSGTINIGTGAITGSDSTGSINITVGNVTGSGFAGSTTLNAGDSSAGNGGNASVIAGEGYTFAGAVNINAGAFTGVIGSGGDVNISSGGGPNGGTIYISGGVGTNGDGGDVYIISGNSNASGTDGYIIFKNGSANEIVRIGTDAMDSFVELGVGTRATTGTVRLPEEFAITSYENPSEVRIIERNAAGELLIGSGFGGSPTTGVVHTYSTGGFYVHTSTEADYAMLQPSLLTFNTDAAVIIARSTHTSGAGSATTISGQNATSGGAGGAIKVQAGAGNGAAAGGDLELYSGAGGTVGGIKIYNGADLRMDSYITTGRGLEIYKPADTTEWSAHDYDRIAFATDANCAVGYSTAHTSGAGSGLSINGQNALAASGLAGGGITVTTGAGDGAAFAGAYVVNCGAVEMVRVDEDANGLFVGLGVAPLATDGLIRLPEEFAITSYEAPSEVRVIERDSAGDLLIGSGLGGSPTTGIVHTYSPGGLYVHTSAVAAYAMLQPSLLVFTTDAAVSITRSTHSSGAGSKTTFSGQDAAGVDKAGGDVWMQTGAPTGTADPGVYEFYCGSNRTFSVYRWVAGGGGTGFGVWNEAEQAGLWLDSNDTTDYQIYVSQSAAGAGLPLRICGQDAQPTSGLAGGDITITSGAGDGAGDGGDIIIQGGADGGSGVDGGIKLNTGAATTKVEIDPTGVGINGNTPVGKSSAYTRNATVVEDRTLLASASATATNNNNVLAALIADLQAFGVLG